MRPEDLLREGAKLVGEAVKHKAAKAEVNLPPLSELEQSFQEIYGNIPRSPPAIEISPILPQDETATAKTSEKPEDMEDNTAHPEKTPENSVSVQDTPIATACVPCAVGHLSASTGLLNEAMRFKGEGILSNEIIDRIAKTLAELNALERVDLTPERLADTPQWEREIAEEALSKSRGLRHKLEAIETIEQLEGAAAETDKYYQVLNRKWYKGRFAHLRPEQKTEVREKVEDFEQEVKDG